jgi:hypothetical protein
MTLTRNFWNGFGQGVMLFGFVYSTWKYPHTALGSDVGFGASIIMVGALIRALGLRFAPQGDKGWSRGHPQNEAECTTDKTLEIPAELKPIVDTLKAKLASVNRSAIRDAIVGFVLSWPVIAGIVFMFLAFPEWFYAYHQWLIGH